MTRAIELGRSSQPGRAGADDSHRTARALALRASGHPALGEGPFDDGGLDGLDGDRRAVDAQHAGRLAGGGTDPARELREVVRRGERVQRGAPLFLNYPDQGLMDLVTAHWSSDTPYRSRYTAQGATYSRTAYRQGAAYSGENVLADLVDIIGQYRPTKVYVPHPSDTHPDHGAGYFLGTLAVETALARDPSAAPYEVRCYLTHSMERPWPSPRGVGLQREMEVPRAILKLDSWESTPLPPGVFGPNWLRFAATSPSGGRRGARWRRSLAPTRSAWWFASTQRASCPTGRSGWSQGVSSLRTALPRKSWGTSAPGMGPE